VRARRTITVIIAVAALATFAQAATTNVTVRRGDTLSDLAQRHGVSVAAIAKANGISDPDMIREGQVLRLPGGGSVSAPAPAPSARYLVRRGDTLSGIAAEHGVSVSAIAAANGITDLHRIIAGRWLKIPGRGGASAPAARSAVHVVKQGETLSGIAARNGLSVAALAGANGIRDVHMIRIGDRLNVPVSGAAAVTSGRLPGRLARDPKRLALLPVFDRWAGEYAVPADLVKAVAWMESGFQNHVRSGVGAIGVGQLMPATVDFVSGRLLETRLDPHQPEQNIRMSARYLRWLLDQTNGDQPKALAAYYQGLRSVRVRGVYTQTLAYVQGVQALRGRFV
jgi:N-acetylmuramoyl-L-alanine amidase